ncbi:uncharacterized protein LOC117343680 [Pecten maximus]|uniref:uncharacterized protein LOC117343680 n=1 Tax=Pecten maximus TaxID=6579 RepID=UPI0014587356|nr:uncharacterized protein LOC117343680 [Pecten maximus]
MVDQVQPAEVENYNSCKQHSKLVQKQIKCEITNGNYVITDEKPVIISALGAIPKSKTKVRLIHDASRPIDKCVNSYVTSDCSCSYMDLREAAKHITPGCYLAKIDLSSAYRSVKIHPSNYKATGLKYIFDGDTSPTFMYDTKLPFGASKSPQIFQTLTSAVCRMLKCKYGFLAIAYLDDFLVFGKTYDECFKAMVKLVQLLRILGFAINWSKLEGPTQEIVFLGVLINTVSMTFSLSRDKLVSFYEILMNFSSRKRASRKQLEVLIGKLNWASQVINGGRTFLRRIINMKDNLCDNSHKMILSEEFFADLHWWIAFMSVFNGTCAILDNKTITSIQTDASSEGGGGYYNGDYFYVNWQLDLPPLAQEHINVKEFLAIYFAFCRWGPTLCNKHVIVYSDNKSAVSWINKGTSRNTLVMYILRLMFWMCAINNVSLKAKYLPGVCNNIADACSRLHEPDKLCLLYSWIPSLSLCDFSVYELSQHMSLHFISHRWLHSSRLRGSSDTLQRKGVG